MSAAPPPRASANAHRPISARCPGLRRFGHPATLPLRWMPDRMRADVLAIREIFRRRPLAGLGVTSGLVATACLTAFMLAGPDRAAEDLAALEHTDDHIQHTLQ